jgi:O-antigen ligase
MKPDRDSNSTSEHRRNYVAIVALVSSLILVFPLLPVPAPSFVTGLSWKVELLSSLALLVFGIWQYVIDREKFVSVFDITNLGLRQTLVILLTAFIVWSAVSSLWSELPSAAAHHSLLWVEYLIVLLIVSNIPNVSRYVIGVFAITASVIAVTCVSDYVGSDFASSEGTIRIRYAKFAELLVTVVPVLFAAALCARDKSTSRWLAAAGTLGWLAVMLSLSKGSFISGVVALLFCFSTTAVFSARHRWRTLRFAGLWLVLTIAVQFAFSVGSIAPSTADYISGKSDPTRSTSQMRIFTWKVARQMITGNWLIGVGGDNFGIRFNDARAEYAAQHPSDKDLAIGEDFLTERAHNEPLQVIAELGIIGFALFIAPFGLLLYFVFITALTKRKLSPVLAGSIAGMIGFLISSMFSSFSFRAAQNGIVFYLLMALAVRQMSCRSFTGREKTHSVQVYPRLAELLAVGVGALLLISSFLSLSMGISRFYQYLSANSTDVGERSRLLDSAINWDRDNAGAWFDHSATFSSTGDFRSAAKMMRVAIEKGVGVPESYSYLATLNLKAGDSQAAEDAMADAVYIFPRTVFARVRYAQLLELNGHDKDANTQFSVSRDIDIRQSNGWDALLRNGDLSAYLASQANDQIAAPADLKPEGAVLQFVDRKSIGGK